MAEQACRSMEEILEGIEKAQKKLVDSLERDGGRHMAKAVTKGDVWNNIDRASHVIMGMVLGGSMLFMAGLFCLFWMKNMMPGIFLCTMGSYWLGKYKIKRAWVKVVKNKKAMLSV